MIQVQYSTLAVCWFTGEKRKLGAFSLFKHLIKHISLRSLLLLNERILLLLLLLWKCNGNVVELDRRCSSWRSAQKCARSLCARLWPKVMIIIIGNTHTGTGTMMFCANGRPRKRVGEWSRKRCCLLTHEEEEGGRYLIRRRRWWRLQTFCPSKMIIFFVVELTMVKVVILFGGPEQKRKRC